MPAISLTNFVDVVAASGTARITKVRDTKRFYEQGYAPERDFYKPLRDRISHAFADGWSTTAFRESLAEVTDPKKVENYEQARKGLTKWVGRKTITAMEPRRRVWRSGELEVSVNPELRLSVNGVTYDVKLYLRADPISKRRADVALHLLGLGRNDGTVAGVLDVRRARLLVPTVDIEGMDALLAAEAAAFSALWNSI
jgi:hypothetical protein